MEYEQHPIATSIPQASESDRANIASSIAANGWFPSDPITLYEGKILDGWTRYREAINLGVEPTYVEFHGDNPASWAFARNIPRRHLTPVQILKVAETMRSVMEAESAAHQQATQFTSTVPANLQGPTKRRENSDLSEKTTSEVTNRIAGMAGVSQRTAASYHAVHVNGSADVKKAVDNEEVSISDAAKIAKKPKRNQNAALKAVREQKAKTLAEAIDKDLATEEDDKPETVDDAIKRENSTLEKFARTLSDLASKVPEVPWLTQGNRVETVRQKIKDAASIVRGAKCHCACPMCEGSGCRQCHMSGRVTKYAHTQLVG